MRRMLQRVELPEVELQDLLELHRGQEVTNKLLVNIRGCNGSGKSTIPISMLERDSDAFEVVWQVNGKKRVVGTVFPEFSFVALGHYHSKCGGMDSMKTTDEIKLAVDVFWNTNYHILMEGIMASTVRQTYIDLFTQMNSIQPIQRDIVVYSILPSLETCLQRIQSRNGGKPIKEELVLSKWKTVDNNVQHFKNAGFQSIRVTNEGITKEQTLEWFFDNLRQLKSDRETSSQHKEKDQQEQSDDPVPVVPLDELRGYEWFPFYREPDETVKFNQKYRDRFWWYICERLRIYYKRVVLKQPYPWTDDVIFKTYRFTNISRDMDKLTIYERDHIIMKLDEPTIDLETRKKSVMFNIMLYRVFVKIPTFEAFGFIDFSDENWRKQWENGKKILLQRREQGIQNFTGSFMMNHFRRCNPDETTRDNKTLNALCMCEGFLENIDQLYNKLIKKCKNMSEQLEYLITITGIGNFTAYEFVTSFAMASRYCKNRLVPWTQDNYTFTGPGSRHGLEWIFKSLGNLSEVEAIIYLRSIWKIEMKRLGYYEEFMEMLPEQLDSDLDLRVIEHNLCESHKYNKVATSTGRLKKRFDIETTDVSVLKL